MKAGAPAEQRVISRGFRLRLMGAIMLFVVVATGAGLVLVQRNALAGAERELHAEFRAALDTLNAAQRARSLYLEQLCRSLVDNSRIHAALEDDALDLLYISARDELGGLMTPRRAAGDAAPVRARFYRFLDATGKVIVPPNEGYGGRVPPEALARLALPRLPRDPQLGFMVQAGGSAAEVDEIIATPIISTDSLRPIAALVVGLDTGSELTGALERGIIRGLWTGDRLVLPALGETARGELAALLAADARNAVRDAEAARIVALGGARHLLLCRALNPGSLYPTSHEVFLLPLAAAEARQSGTRWRIIGAGALILLGGLGASHLVASRMARPVEKLARDSETNALQRTRAEEALELTQAELERSARFSANASHQLKTPVAVLRAGLDELLVRDDLPPGVREELQSLVGETTRFTSMIEDLLLLSRMDAGRVRIEFAEVDLTLLVEAALDDLSVLPDPFGLTIDSRLTGPVPIRGERRYVAHILQNLLENARRYNRAGGRIELSIRADERGAVLVIGNNGRPIPREHQPHIFDRFHRGTAAENLPGHGLGLNLARELSRLHGGDLRLVASENDWTEFEVVFPRAAPEAPAAG